VKSIKNSSIKLRFGKTAKKKNEEFTEAQKTYKDQVENHNKTFTEQLKVRNEEF